MVYRPSLRAILLRGSILTTASRKGSRRAALSACGVLALLSLAPALAQTAPALPAGGVFVSGAGEIGQASPTALTITQSSSRGVIDWRDFSIALDNQVRVENGSGATLNRVTGGTLSRIDGMLSASGSVYLVNTNGVVVGPGGKVLTGGDFVATTRAIDADAFMAGGPLAIAGNSNGEIANSGSIVSKTGSVVLIARAVTNSGTIQARQGRVTLAAADDVLMAATDGKSDGIYVSVGAGGGDITQTGRIAAAAVALKAANGNIFALAGNRDGLIQATGTATIQGELWLTAPKGSVQVAGTLAATNADSSGGRIGINASDVALTATAKLSAAGNRGGEVLVGTAQFGTGTQLAATTSIATGATITAGGPAGGGRIETSGKALSLGAATITAGAGGAWLLDPNDIVIDAAAAAAITTSLNANTNVTQQTTAGGTGGVGDISVNADLAWTGTGNLTLDAVRDVAVNNLISGGGSVTLLAGRNVNLAAPVSGTAVTATVTNALTIAAAGRASASGNVTLNTGTFVNQRGADALRSTGGNWFVYSGNPASDTTGGLAPDFYQYNAPAGTTPAASGNGLLYSLAPSVSFTLNAVTKSYDGTTTALLDATNTNVTGLINGDAFTLDGSYATKDAGTGIAVTATNFTANHGGTPVFGYAVATPSVTAPVGVINPANLIAAIIGNPTKTYNATTAASLAPGNFALTGVAAGESITVTGAASSSYDSANAGIRTVNATFTTPNFTAGSGTNLNNYVLPTAATGAGLINQAPINVLNVTANDKVYDSTTTAALNTGSASIFGVVGSDVVTLDVSGATGVFATKNVGNAIAVTGTGFALTGASAANYIVSQPTGMAANITRATVEVSDLLAFSKVYDGTTAATIDTTNLVVTGIFPGDDVFPDASRGTASVTFASKDVATNIPVTIGGVGLFGADAGNYNLTFSGSLAADITPRPLTLSVVGNPTKVYDGTAAAFLSPANAALGNVVAGESVSVAQATTAQYASKDAGNRTITATLSPSDYVAGAGTSLSNYILPTSATGAGTITQALLSINIIGNPTKGYDGNDSATLAPANYTVDGFIAGEDASVTQTHGTYASSNAGVWTVTATLGASDFAPIAGTLMANYIIPATASGIGTITRIDLGTGVIFADITGNPTKTYDGNTVATLTPADYTLTGFIAGEGATVTETVGTYGNKDAGIQSVLALLDPGDFVADPGTNLTNYNLPSEATGFGTILRAPLGISIIGNPTKVYNGGTSKVLTSANYDISGLVAGESASVSDAVVVAYDSKNAGARTLSASFGPSSISFGSNTLRANYIVPTSATGPGTITPAPLNILNTTALSKVYDTTNVAQLSVGGAALFGVVAGDTVTLSTAGSTGVFATANAGNGIAVTTSGFTISGADIANYTLFQPSGLSANITPKGLAILNVSALDKFYDGTPAATLDLSTAALSGVFASDTITLNISGATASFLQSNVGTDLRVNAGGFALVGANASNYSLGQPSGLTADINPRALAGAILGNPTKTYDGTNLATLGAANYSLTGFIAGEGATITQSAGSLYDSANAGPRTVTATLVVSDIAANPGTLLSNYVLPGTISGAGTINQALLSAAIVGNPTKVYDNTTTAALTSANYSLNGFVGSEGATVTRTIGAYDSDNAGSRIVTATLGAGDFTAVGSTNLANYQLPGSASGAGTITRASVQVINIDAQDKVYDGTTAATLITGAGGLSGVFGGDTVNLVSTGASGTFATKNVGTNITVTALGFAIGGADAGNYDVVQPIGIFADITQAAIQLASVTKIYDATTAVPTVGSAYTLSGVFGGDAVGVDASAIAGNYDNKNVGTGKLVTLSGVALTGADAGNYLIAPTATNAPIGIITPATLNVLGAVALDKTYDQNTIAQIDNSGTALNGVFAGDVVTLATASTGNFNNANAGTNKPVTTTAYSISGIDAPNYILTQPQGLTAAINPLEIFLASVTKVYDGTTGLPTASSGYGFTGILGGDTVVAQTSGVTGQYNDSKNVGTAKPVTVNGLILTGASGGNYFVSGSITDTIGTITQASLAAAIIGNPTKTYDATNAATLTSGNYQLIGFVAGEGAAVTETAGTYDSVNQGARTVSAILDSGDFTANGGTLLSNYVLPTSASGAGTIDPRLLTILGVIANDKVYDGNTVAILDSASAALINVVPGDTVALNSAGATGLFTSPNVGTNIAVTASGYALTNNPSGNYTLQQPTGLSADITAALLTLTKVSRTYSALTTLPGVAAAYTLSGAVAGDDVTVDAAAAAASGSYADKNVGTGILVTIGNLALSGAAASNYSIASSLVSQPIGEITPAALGASIIGTPTRIYDGTNTVLLTTGNYQLTGFFGGEGATVTETAGLYDSANAGPRTVTATLDAGDFTANGGTLLSNYILPASASGAGQIDPKALAVTIIGTPTKTYDGTMAATLTAANYDLTGFIAGQSATVTQIAGTYDSANAGARIVTATLGAGDFTAGGGTLLSNYVLPTAASGAGLINQALLTAAIIGTPTKTYDANTAITLAAGNYQLTGFVAGEGATVSETAGIFASPDAGSHTITATLASGDFTGTGGTLLSNYVLPTSASGGGLINQASLSAAIIGNPTKSYDGTTLATLTTANYALTGFVGSQGASVTQTSGSYGSANAGARAVTASLASGDFTANGGTLFTNYVLPVTATGAGQIDPALLTATIIGNPTKIYDGTNIAALTSANFAVSGFVASEGATVSRTTGTYDSANAGTRTVTTNLTSSDFTSTGATLLANYVLPISASGAGLINRATLQASITGIPAKEYDGTALATLTPGNYALTGFVAGDGATVSQSSGTYVSPNAGLRLIGTTLAGSDFVPTGGTLLANYNLPTTASGAGLITKRALTAAVIGLPTKTYDGTAAATLTSSNYALTGFVSGEGGTITETAGTYASANAGLRGITVTLGSADFTANGGTLLANYALPLTAAGPGLINQALLTAAITGNPTKTYDGNTAATLTPGNYALTGFVAGEGATVTETAGTYDTANVGSRTVTALFDASDFTAAAGTTLGNYVLPTNAAGAGTIGLATLTAAIVGTPTKIYDGTDVATLTAANYALTGFAVGEGATVSQTVGAYASANAGARTVTAALAGADFTPNGSTLLANYILPTSASGAGLINQAILNAIVVGAPTNTYDGTDLATLSSTNYALTGFIAGEGATITQTVGAYASPNAGPRIVTANLAAGDFAADSGTTLGNYVLPSSAIGAGLINQATLGAIIVGNPTKAYDGTTAATLSPGNYQLTGFVAGESATVSQTAGGYAAADAGVRLVNATLANSNFAAGSGTLLSNYVLPTSATGLGTIDRALLTATIVNDPTKVYDGATAATLASGNFGLTGFAEGEGATVTQTVGVYGSANAGLRIVSATLDASDFTANDGAALSNYILPASASGTGHINQALLAAAIVGNPTKTYDGIALATLTQGNYALTGFIAGEGATITQIFGAYNSPDAGARTITAMLPSGDYSGTGGTLLTNYVLPTSASGAGLINQKVLAAAITGNPAKTYDGNTLATLTPANYALTGFVRSQGATVTRTQGSYGQADAGVRTVATTLASGDFTADSGTLLANYILPVSASGLGRIDPASLTAIIVGLPTKIYDGTDAATLTSADYSLAGFVAGEGATITQTGGTYASANAGPRTVTANLAAGDFTAGSGTLLSNYVLPSLAIGAGLINQATLAAIIVGNPTKAYDGTTAAALTPGNYTLTGFVTGESGTITQTAGSYAASDAGVRILNTTLAGSDFLAGSGTLLSNYVLPATATGLGTIDRAPLTASIVNEPTKVYDAYNAAALTSGNFSLAGFAAGQGATVTETAATFDSANAGARTVTAFFDTGDFTAAGGTLLTNYVLPTSAIGAGLINRADLTVAITGRPTKPYDGNTNATLIPGDYAIAGFVAGEGASVTETHGTYADPAVGVRNVTVALDSADFAANGGTLLSNYNLPISAAGEGEILGRLIGGSNCAILSSAECQIEFPSFPHVVGNPRFYIPYPSADSVYFAQTNGFAALPGILWQSSSMSTPDGVLITSGTPIVNSAGQILLQGQTAKQWAIRFPRPVPLDTSGIHP